MEETESPTEAGNFAKEHDEEHLEGNEEKARWQA